MTAQEQEIFPRNAGGTPRRRELVRRADQGDAPAIAQAKQALAKAEAFERGHSEPH
jgi:hypothetical protein